MSRGKILVIRGGAIGDFILTLPVLAALRQQFPETGIEVLGYPKVAELALAGGLADAVRSIEARPMAGFFARNGVLDPGLQEYFASFALIISFLYDPDSIFQENVGRCSKAQFIAGSHRPDEGENLHASEVFLKTLERLAIFEADPQPRLSLGASTAQPADLGWIRTKRTLAVHPGSGSEQKNWPEERWQGLLRRLGEETDLQVLLVGGEAEGERLRRLAEAIAPERRRIANSLRLTEVAMLLRHCFWFLGHDSGISHLAAAVGGRGLVLWGPTNEKLWRPRSEKIQLLKPASDLASLTVDEVFNALTGPNGIGTEPRNPGVNGG